jgi:hypothetical protein
MTMDNRQLRPRQTVGGSIRVIKRSSSESSNRKGHHPYLTRSKICKNGQLVVPSDFRVPSVVRTVTVKERRKRQFTSQIWASNVGHEGADVRYLHARFDAGSSLAHLSS